MTDKLYSANTMAEREMAALARLGGSLYRQHWSTGMSSLVPRGELDGFVRRDAEWVMTGKMHLDHGIPKYGAIRHDATIPDVAVEWPVYRAALS